MKKKKTYKRIYIFDFDDTLAHTDSHVIFRDAEGKQTRLNSAQFAGPEGQEKLAAGYTPDYSEFNEIPGAKPTWYFGPLEGALSRNEDVRILTARPHAARESIRDFIRNATGRSDVHIETGAHTSSDKARKIIEWINSEAEAHTPSLAVMFYDDSSGNIKKARDAVRSDPSFILDPEDDVESVEHEEIRGKFKGMDVRFYSHIANVTRVESMGLYETVLRKLLAAGRR